MFEPEMQSKEVNEYGEYIGPIGPQLCSSIA